MQTQFLSLPNELILTIWHYLGHAHAIHIFSYIPNQDLNSLLQRYCYRTLDFTRTTLPCFQHFCSHLFQVVRHSLETLKIGRHSSSSQLHLLAQSFGCKSSSDRPTSSEHLSFTVDAPLTEVFPKLHTLIIYNAYLVEDDDLAPFLSLFRQLRCVSFYRCRFQSPSNLISRYLLVDNQNDRLTHLQLRGYLRNDGYVFPYSTSSSYLTQPSLQHLLIDVLDLQSLINLLHFLPQLTTLGESSRKKIVQESLLESCFQIFD